jgi:hypothetical protein
VHILKKIIFSLIFLSLAVGSQALELLPVCEGSNFSKWDNCIANASFSDGSRYEGTYRNGKKNGSGKYSLSNGDIYIGQMVNDAAEGFGTLLIKNGDKYVGQFKDNNYHGQGIFTFNNGQPKKEGLWENDKFVKPQNINLAEISPQGIQNSVELPGVSNAQKGVNDTFNFITPTVKNGFKFSAKKSHNSKELYVSLFIKNSGTEICSISDDESSNFNSDINKIALSTYVENISTFKPEGFKGKLGPQRTQKFYDDLISNDLIFNYSAFNNFFGLLARGWDRNNRYTLDMPERLGTGKADGEKPGCKILVGFPEHILDLATELSKRGYTAETGKEVPTKALLDLWSQRLFSLNWDTFEYIYGNYKISTVALTKMKLIGISDIDSFNALLKKVNSGQQDKEYMATRVETEIKDSLTTYIMDYADSKASGKSIEQTRDLRRIQLQASLDKKAKDKALYDAEESKRLTALRQKRDLARQSKIISTGVFCIGDEYTAKSNMIGLMNAYAAGQNGAEILRYIQGTYGMCVLQRNNYPAKNFVEVTGTANLIMLESKAFVSSNKKLYTLVPRSDWEVGF